MPRARAMMSGYPAGSAMRGWRSADGAVNGRVRIALGGALTGSAHAAIDLSDGLTGDLMHLLTRSNVCEVIDIDQVPRSAALARMPPDIQRRCDLGGADDYELCFT